jgi:predicted nucleic acid-binding protein
MKTFLDTNVLVAAVLETHEHYEPSFQLFSRSHPRQTFCGAHNLAEVYAILTRYPSKDRLTSDQALTVLETIQERVTIVALTVQEYVAAIREFAAMGIAGGAIYDGLIASCALKVGADILYTWNTGHFIRLGDDIAGRVRTPAIS